MLVTKCILGSGYKVVALNLYRSIQTTPILIFRVSDNRSRRVGTRSQSPFLRRRLMKDSEFVDINDLNGDGNSNPSPDFLEEAYNEQMRGLKDETRKISKIIMKKSFGKRPKEPNMLTFNERQHMIYLHNSDPVEWSAEHLSESFPALPWAIRKILKNKWIPENEEKIKIMDENVLKNWEKLKENKLEASQELLEHLKKFTDKRENLKIQLKNPKFFYFPEMKQKLTWKSGKLNSFLLKYEKEVEKLRENSLNVKSLPENVKGSENMIYSGNGTENQTGLVNVNENGNCKESLLEDGTKVEPKFQIRKRGKPITLQELKKNIFEKAEDKKNLVSPVEEVIIRKTLTKGDRSETQISKSDSSRRRNFYTENESKCSETTSKLSNGIKDSRRRNFYTENESKCSETTSKLSNGIEDEVLDEDSVRRKYSTRRKLPTENKNFDEVTDEFELYPNIYKITELGSKLYGAENDKQAGAVIGNEDEKKNIDASRVKQTEKKTVKPVNYFNTEKDKQIYENHEKLLSQTIFWDNKKRKKSLDAGLGVYGTASSPHIASHIQTYFTYDYPLKIKIPGNKKERNKLYKVKDCYYDDTGKFLYRVPGMSE